MKRFLCLSVALAGCLSIVWTASADTKSKMSPTNDGLKFWFNEVHTGLHPNQCSGTTTVKGQIVSISEIQKVRDADGKLLGYRYHLRVGFDAPLSGYHAGHAPRLGIYQGTKYYAEAAEAKGTFVESKLIVGLATAAASYFPWPNGPYTNLEVIDRKVLAHSVERRVVKRPWKDAAAALPPAGPVLAYDFLDGGTPSVDSQGHGVYDANGDIVYDVAPAAAIRFESEVAAVSGTTTYTYRVVNLRSESRTFLVREVVTAQFPAGWTGTVSANATETLSFSVTGEDTYRRKTQVDLDAIDAGGDFRGVPTLFLPDSLLPFPGMVASVSVGNDPVLGQNQIVFIIDGAAAEIACLVRINASGEYERLQEWNSTFAEGIPYTFTDNDYSAGQNSYYVVVGVRTEGARSETVAITNN